MTSYSPVSWPLLLCWWYLSSCCWSHWWSWHQVEARSWYRWRDRVQWLSLLLHPQSRSNGWYHWVELCHTVDQLPLRLTQASESDTEITKHSLLSSFISCLYFICFITTIHLLKLITQNCSNWAIGCFALCLLSNSLTHFHAVRLYIHIVA